MGASSRKTQSNNRYIIGCYKTRRSRRRVLRRPNQKSAKNKQENKDKDKNENKIQIYEIQNIDIFVHLITGKKICLSVLPSDSVESIQRLIYLQTGINLEHYPDYRLVFAGQDLRFDRALKDYGITNLSVLSLVKRVQARGS